MAFQHSGTRCERAIQGAGFRTKKHQGANRCQAGEVARTAVVGDQQVAMEKQTGEGFQILGIAHQVDATLMATSGLDGLGQGLVFRQTDDANRASFLAQAFGQGRVMRCRPGADRQQPPACVKQHPLGRAHEHRMVAVQGLGEAGHVAMAEMHLQARVQRFVVQHHGLGARHGVALQGIDQGHELQADVAIGVVGNGRVEKRATVQTLLGVRRETRFQPSTAAVSQQSTDAGKQFAIDHRIELQGPQSPQHLDQISQQAHQGGVVNAVQLGFRCQAQQTRHRLVALQLQDVDLHAGVLLAQLLEHRAGQHHAAHLGQHDDQDFANGLLGRGCSTEQAVPDRHHATQQGPCPSVDAALCVDVHETERGL